MRACVIAVYLFLLLCPCPEVASAHLANIKMIRKSKVAGKHPVTGVEIGAGVAACALLATCFAGGILEHIDQKNADRSAEIARAMKGLVGLIDSSEISLYQIALSGLTKAATTDSLNQVQKVRTMAREIRKRVRSQSKIWYRSSPLVWLSQASDQQILDFLGRLSTERSKLNRVDAEEDPWKTRQIVVLAFMATIPPEKWRIPDDPRYTLKQRSNISRDHVEVTDLFPFVGEPGWNEPIQAEPIEEVQYSERDDRGAHLNGNPGEAEDNAKTMALQAHLHQAIEMVQESAKDDTNPFVDDLRHAASSEVHKTLRLLAAAAHEQALISSPRSRASNEVL